jgi:hypothetical protein
MLDWQKLNSEVAYLRKFCIYKIALSHSMPQRRRLSLSHQLASYVDLSELFGV